MGPATPPADPKEESPPPEPQRALPTPFLAKTYQMVDDPIVDDIISWNEEGSTFVVWRPAEFARDLLPKYFKHNNFSSFVRQLNTYGFRKIVPDRWEFSNDCFRKGEKRMLCDIHRRKISLPAAVAAAISPQAAVPVNRALSPTNSVEEQGEQVISSNSSPPPPGSMTELVEENERLRKENRKLAHELSKMKNLCNNIFLLMSKYAVPTPEALELMPARQLSEDAEEIGVKTESSSPPPPPPPPSYSGAGSSAWNYDRNPIIFGVSIGQKRCREVEDDDELPAPSPSLSPAVKLEPFELESYQLRFPAPPASPAAEAAEQKPWVVYCPRPQRRRVCNVEEDSDGAHVS